MSRVSTRWSFVIREARMSCRGCRRGMIRKARMLCRGCRRVIIREARMLCRGCRRVIIREARMLCRGCRRVTLCTKCQCLVDAIRLLGRSVDWSLGLRCYSARFTCGSYSILAADLMYSITSLSYGMGKFLDARQDTVS